MVQVVYEVDGRQQQKLELDLPPNYNPNSTTVCKTCKSISLTRPQLPVSDTSSVLPMGPLLFFFFSSHHCFASAFLLLSKRDFMMVLSLIDENQNHPCV
ncbi:hypothetical protein Hanom_Chr06g00569441 [Helianthus anomalus]